MSTPTLLPIRLTQTLGLTSSLLLAGQTITLSTFLIPRLLDSPTPLMLRQWNAMYQPGKKQGPPFAAVAASSYWYLAWDAYKTSTTTTAGSASLAGSSSRKVAAYIIAGALAIGIVPYTLMFIKGTNVKLLQKVEETRGMTVGKGEVVVQDEGARELVDWWGMLNLGRGMLVLGSGVLGVWTVLS